MKYKLMFYDFEVFRYDWLVVLIDYTSKRKCVIHNDVERLRQVYEKCNKLGYIWVGYNSRNYDAPLLKSILCGKNAYEVNDALINKGLKEIGQELGISKLSSNWARHSWASIARNKAGISMSDIDFCLGHVSHEHKMADIYIDIDYSICDRANRKVLDLLK